MPRPFHPGLLLAIALRTLLCALPASAAQGHLIRAEMSVAPQPGPAETVVRLRYVVKPAGDTVVPLSIVLFDSTSIADVSVRMDGRILSIEALDGAGSARTGGVHLSASDAALDSLELGFEYTIRPRTGATTDRTRLPVLAVLWPPEDATPGTFRATLLTPEGYSAYDPLPSVLREIRSENGAHTYEATLQVVPAMFSFRLTMGEPPRIGLAGFLDGAVLVLLAAFTWVGWRHFRAGD